MVVVNWPSLGKLLGDAENPAHTMWAPRKSRVGKRWRGAETSIRFVQRSAAEIVRRLLAGTGEAPRDVESRTLGALHDESVLRDAYRAADVFAVPTIADVLAQTAQESIACGTPCVSFDRGGVTEVVRHLETGYQAELGNVDSLAQGLVAMLADDDLIARLSARCRDVATREYGLDLQVARYVELYDEVLAAA